MSLLRVWRRFLGPCLAGAVACAAPVLAQESGGKGPAHLLGLATTVPEAADFVKRTRPAPDSLDYMNIGTPRDEPRTTPLSVEKVEARQKANDALAARRRGMAAARPTRMAPAPRLPASALRAKSEHDAQMRERATRAE
jgi:hypothetical protein